MRLLSILILMVWILAVICAAEGNRARIGFIMALSLIIPLVYIVCG